MSTEEKTPDVAFSRADLDRLAEEASRYATALAVQEAEITRLQGLLKEAGEEIDGCKRALQRIADMPFAGREDDACGEDDAYSDGYDKAIDDASTMAKNGLDRLSPDLSDRIRGV